MSEWTKTLELSRNVFYFENKQILTCLISQGLWLILECFLPVESKKTKKLLLFWFVPIQCKHCTTDKPFPILINLIIVNLFSWTCFFCFFWLCFVKPVTQVHCSVACLVIKSSPKAYESRSAELTLCVSLALWIVMIWWRLWQSECSGIWNIMYSSEFLLKKWAI